MRRALVVVAAAALLLAGCAEIPTSGTVQPGSTEGPGDTSIVYIPNPPAPGASQRDIVTGFVQAASAGGDFHVAKEFLTTGFAKKWDPHAGVLVQQSAPSTLVASGTADLRLEVPLAARVDGTGVYTPSTQMQPLDFHLEQEGGQWRIAAAPDGIVLAEIVFQKNYFTQTLQFFDPTWKRLVPDLRWLPQGASGNGTGVDPSVKRVVSALIAGPSAPLIGGVTANALAGARLQSVGETGGGAISVALTVPGGDPDTVTTGRMQQQLIRSLVVAPSALRLVVNGRIAPQVEPLQTPTTSTLPYVVMKGRFGTLTTRGGLAEDPLLGKRIVALAPRAVTYSASQRTAAVLTDAGEVAGIGQTGAPVRDTRPGLVAPSLDQQGWIYSVPREDPGGLIAFTTKGRRVDLGTELGGASVTAMEVSPDGTRLLVLTRSSSGKPSAYVYGIERAPDGAPVGLSAARYLISLSGGAGTGRGATWADNSAVAVLVDAPDGQTSRVTIQRPGGLGSALGEVPFATTIVGTPIQRDLPSQSELQIRLKTGDLVVWQNNAWQQEFDAAVDVSVLAVQR